jgi:hypothetical protein
VLVAAMAAGCGAADVPPPATQVLAGEFQDFDTSARIDCAVKQGGLQQESTWSPEVVAVTVNRSPRAGYCEVVAEFDLGDRTDGTQTHQIMRRLVWFEIGEEIRLAFSLPGRYEVRNARAHGSVTDGAGEWESLRPDFAAFEVAPRVECAVREGGLQQPSRWDPEIVALTVNRSPRAGYCDVVVEFDLTDREDGTRTSQVFRRTAWFEIGEEGSLRFALPAKYEIRNARVHVE